MGEGNRTVLPEPLVGFYDTTRLATVTFSEPLTIRGNDRHQLAVALDELEHYPDGVHDSGEILSLSPVYSGPVHISSYTCIHLTVGLRDEDTPVTLLATLLDRLKVTADGIRATASAYEPAVTAALENAGLVMVADQSVIGPGGTGINNPQRLFAWEK